MSSRLSRFRVPQGGEAQATEKISKKEQEAIHQALIESLRTAPVGTSITIDGVPPEGPRLNQEEAEPDEAGTVPTDGEAANDVNPCSRKPAKAKPTIIEDTDSDEQGSSGDEAGDDEAGSDYDMDAASSGAGSGDEEASDEDFSEEEESPVKGKRKKQVGKAVPSKGKKGASGKRGAAANKAVAPERKPKQPAAKCKVTPAAANNSTMAQRNAAAKASPKAALAAAPKSATTAAAPLQPASVLSTGPAIKKLCVENEAPGGSTPLGSSATVLARANGSACSAMAAKVKGVGSVAGNSGAKSWTAGSGAQVWTPASAASGTPMGGPVYRVPGLRRPGKPLHNITPQSHSGAK